MPSKQSTLLLVCLAVLLPGRLPAALVSSTASLSEYASGTDQLVVYTDVPGHGTSVINGYQARAKSDIYEIWVRSPATDNTWVQCFANMTYNRGAEMPTLAGFNTATASHAYQKFTAGWTHSYANIEMSDLSSVTERWHGVVRRGWNP